ncbi:RNA-binding protein [Desulforamulus ferrireducens]|uniref:Photosystem II S4 domain protein n=1 Tax=Desulforamulus ferrireducens TaxID=1833852 RepID=A0A1S6IUA9_9FIRM|nr:YlmH/Sll1252 family protein [Desulforamulus ferrireducens]AQS58334.1 photosystem II S4 domain protein [Desulforamulus ferrireducens]
MKLNRQALLNHLRDPEEKALLAKVLDGVDKVLRHHRPLVTNFYDPYHTGLIISLLERFPDLDFATFGGYDTAERVRIAIFPNYLEEAAVDFGISLLAVEGNFKMVKVNHRDFLGSLLGLGIKRELIGDLLVNESGCQVATTQEVVPYLTANLTKVHRVKVEVREIDLSELILPELKIKEINTTVASLRLDAIAAAGFGTSRSRIAREILSEKLSVNWHVCSELAAPVKEGDMLSLRGRGRVEVAEIKGNTRSGRISVVLRRYL